MSALEAVSQPSRSPAAGQTADYPQESDSWRQAATFGDVCNAEPAEKASGNERKAHCEPTDDVESELHVKPPEMKKPAEAGLGLESPRGGGTQALS